MKIKNGKHPDSTKYLIQWYDSNTAKCMMLRQWFTGLNHNALVRTLETTLMQPGIKKDNVVVRVHSLR